MASRAHSLLPDSVFYRAVAAAFRLRSEQRLLFVRELVSRDRIAVDVGAWWGPWTYWLSRRATGVWSFEPNPDMAAFLRRVSAPNVHVENVALSDDHGEASLFIPQGVGRDALATLSHAHSTDDSQPVKVPLRTLDDYSLDDVGFIKVDVEGHEFQFLKGAEQTLARCSPTLLVEVEQVLHEEPIRHVFEWLTDRGYEGRLRRNRSWAPLSTFDVQEDQRASMNAKSAQYINNFVFTPVAVRKRPSPR